MNLNYKSKARKLAQHLMNAFNEMNYHQIKSRENFLFMFSVLAASVEISSGENERKVYIERERNCGGDERDFPFLSDFSFSLKMKSRKKSPHEIVNCSMICLMYKLRAIFIFHVHVCDTSNRIMLDINSFLRVDGFSEFFLYSCFRVFVQLMREREKGKYFIASLKTST